MQFSAQPQAAQDLLISGAMAAAMFGLCRSSGGAPDGDWVAVAAPPAISDRWAPAPPQALRSALTVAIATKVNY